MQHHCKMVEIRDITQNPPSISPWRSLAHPPLSSSTRGEPFEPRCFDQRLYTVHSHCLCPPCHVEVGDRLTSSSRWLETLPSIVSSMATRTARARFVLHVPHGHSFRYFDAMLCPVWCHAVLLAGVCVSCRSDLLLPALGTCSTSAAPSSKPAMFCFQCEQTEVNHHVALCVVRWCCRVGRWWA